MIIEYALNKDDFLSFQMFMASKSIRINKKKLRGWVFLTLVNIIVSIYFFLEGSLPMSIYFGIVAVVCALYYPRYFKWRYKKHYQSYIKENYSQRFGESAFIELNETFIFSKDKTGESKINFSEIDKIDETDAYFFIQISSGLSLIIPKAAVNNLNAFKSFFSNFNITISENINWEW